MSKNTLRISLDSRMFRRLRLYDPTSLKASLPSVVTLIKYTFSRSLTRIVTSDRVPTRDRLLPSRSTYRLGGSPSILFKLSRKDLRIGEVLTSLDFIAAYRATKL